MFRNSITVLLFTCSLFIMVGCEHDQEIDPEQDHLVQISFSAQPLSGSLLKSTGSQEENLISKVILFGVNEQGVVIHTFPNLPASGTQLIISRKVKTLYAIANPTDALANADPANVSGLMDMTIDFANAPKSPFVMSCIKEVNISTTANINLEFVRTVAKINVTGTVDFQITKVVVSNVTSKAYVFSRNTFSVPSSTKATYSDNGSNPVIYIAENSKSSPVKVTVTGVFQEEAGDYDFTITSGKSNIDIIRNTSYQVNVRVEYED